VVSVSLHAREGETDATGEKTTTASEEVLFFDAAAGGEGSLPSARVEEVAADGVAATIERATPIFVGEPPSEVDSFIAPVLTAPLVVVPTPTLPEVGAPKILQCGKGG
jgi:hypothetical protein